MNFVTKMIIPAVAGLTILAACEDQSSDSGATDARPLTAFCAADQMQGLVGKPASEAYNYLEKVPVEQRTPMFIIGSRQELPGEGRGQIIVETNAPGDIPATANVDLSKYMVSRVYCKTN